MIVGVVTAAREAVIQVAIRDPAGRDHQTEAVIDTGFTGALTLPWELIRALGLGWLGREGADLADGGHHFFDTYQATVIWDGRPIEAMVLASETIPLVGMALMWGYDLTLRATNGGTVTLEPIR